MNKFNYETVSQAVNDLQQRGYTLDFALYKDKDCIICNHSSLELSPKDFVIDETYRFEGETDPGDEMIVFAISSKTLDVKGILVNGYGLYADSETSKIVKHLKEQSEG